MKLMTKELANRLRKAGDDNQTILAKFFHPCGRWTWYVLSGREEEGDWLFFGYVVSGLGPDCDEYGYFRLSELSSAVGPFGLKVERDLYYPPGRLISEELSRFAA